MCAHSFIFFRLQIVVFIRRRRRCRRGEWNYSRCIDITTTTTATTLCKSSCREGEREGQRKGRREGGTEGAKDRGSERQRKRRRDGGRERKGGAEGGGPDGEREKGREEGGKKEGESVWGCFITRAQRSRAEIHDTLVLRIGQSNTFRDEKTDAGSSAGENHRGSPYRS